MNAKRNEAKTELTTINQQLAMFDKIRKLYNIRFDHETRQLTQRAAQLRVSQALVG